jgi:hypothetical protein
MPGYLMGMNSGFSAYGIYSLAFGVVLFADLVLLGIFLMFQILNKK